MTNPDILIYDFLDTNNLFGFFFHWKDVAAFREFNSFAKLLSASGHIELQQFGGDWGKTRLHSMHSSSSEQMSSFHMKGFLQLSKRDIIIIISIIVDVFCTLIFQFNKASTGVFLTSISRLCFQMEK